MFTRRFCRGCILVLGLLGSLLSAALVNTLRAEDVIEVLSDKALQKMRVRDIERAKHFDRIRQTDGTETRDTALPDASRAPALPEDLDDDGMSDSWERANGLNPGNPADAWLDRDGDYVVNLFEYQLGSGVNDPASPPVVTAGNAGATYANLEDALRAVPAKTYIRVAEGTHRVNYMTFSPRNIMIQGGWNANFTDRNLLQRLTILDGGTTGDEVLYFSFYSGQTAVILDGLRFVRGNGSFGAVNLIASGSSTIMRTSLLNCAIADSSSSYSFGPVLNVHNWTSSAADRTIANTVIANNTASGIYAQITESSIARWRIINSTISGNTNGGGDNGYGIEAFTLEGGRLDARVSNTIIWGNEQEDLSFLWNISFAANYSDIGRVAALYGAVYLPGGGMLNANPLFVNPTGGNYHLSNNSRCIDAGFNGYGPPTDLDGRSRPLDGNGDGQAVCDVGAYEYIAAVARPDLAVGTGSLLPDSGPPGRIVRIHVRVENRGNATALGNWTRVYLSRDATYGPEDALWIQGIQIPALSPGQGHDYIASVAIPSLPFAAYHVLAYCDADNALVESNELNNWTRIGTLVLTTHARGWFLYR